MRPYFSFPPDPQARRLCYCFRLALSLRQRRGLAYAPQLLQRTKTHEVLIHEVVVQRLSRSRADGKAIEYSGGKFSIPDHPIIPFIEGDGTGRDIWKASQRVFDAAVEHAYGGKRSIAWFEVFAGEKAFNKFKEWLPQDTVDAARDFRISIKGPLTTPVGGGIRSLNVALRQILDLYACVRPVRYFPGVPSPVKHPERMNLVIFRENTEDVYIGIEWQSGTPEVKKLIEFLNKDMLKGGPKQIRWDSGVSIKPISPTGTKRLVRRAIEYAIENKRTRRHPDAQGQHPEIHRRRASATGATNWRATNSARQIVTERESWILDNLDKNPGLTVEQNAAMIEPGLEQGTEAFRKEALRRGEAGARFHRRDPRQRPVEAEAHDQRPHRRLHLPADCHPRRRISGARHAEPERRLHLRRRGRAGRRTRHGAGRQHRRRLRRASRPPTAPRRNMPTRTSSIRAR